MTEQEDSRILPLEAGNLPQAKVLFNLIKSRRSTRRYTDESIPIKTILRLLEAAAWAPSAHNRQPWRFAVLTQPSDKERLAGAMGARLRADRTADGDDPVDIERDVARSYARLTGAPVATGEGSSGHSLKAVTMMNVVTIIMSVNLPAIVITHMYDKHKHGDLEKKEERDSISPLEEARWKLAFNLKFETFKDKKGYGVIVRECRERPGLKPFIIRDVEGGMYRTMPERIMKALYEAEQPVEEAKGWAAFGVANPFPDKGDQFKQNAVKEMINYFVVVDGERFYAFGDPAATPIKKNGEPGVSGVANKALNAYTKVARQFKADGGKNLGQLTVKLKEYTEAKVREVISAYLDSKIAAQAEQRLEAPPEPRPELVEGLVEGLVERQPGLGLEVEDPIPTGGGAAYVDR